MIASFGHGFTGHTSNGPGAFTFITSPRVILTLAVTKSLYFGPLGSHLIGRSNRGIGLDRPRNSRLPSTKFMTNGRKCRTPNNRGGRVEITPSSRQLRLLAPFPT